MDSHCGPCLPDVRGSLISEPHTSYTLCPGPVTGPPNSEFRSLSLPSSTIPDVDFVPVSSLHSVLP